MPFLYHNLLKELEAHIDIKRWQTKDGGPLFALTLATQWMQMLVSFKMEMSNS